MVFFFGPPGRARSAVLPGVVSESQIGFLALGGYGLNFGELRQGTRLKLLSGFNHVTCRGASLNLW